MKLLTLIKLRRLNNVQNNADTIVNPGIELQEIKPTIDQTAVGITPEPEPDERAQTEQNILEVDVHVAVSEEPAVSI